jgi:hypothetical protein
MPWERTVSESSALTIRLTIAGGGTQIIADGTAGDREDCQTLTRIVARLSIRRSHPGVRASDGGRDGGSTVAASGFRMVRTHDSAAGRRAFGAMVKMTVNITGGYSAPVTGWPAMAPLLGSDGLARVQRRTVGRGEGRGDDRRTVAG